MLSALLIGLGGMGSAYAQRIFPQVGGRAEITAICDIDRAALDRVGDLLALPPSARFQRPDAAIAAAEVDFCIIVTPPWNHVEPFAAACRAGLPVLLEKPISSDFDQVLEMARLASESGITCQVVQNYRYSARMIQFKRLLDSGELGPLQYIVARFADDYREYGSWGGPSPFRHEMADPMVLDGSIHHLDMIRHLSGGNPVQVFASAYNPPWSSFKGLAAGLYLVELDNDTRAGYEANLLSAGTPNSWYEEYYRAECQHGSIATAGPNRLVIACAGRADRLFDISDDGRQAHARVLEQFLSWLESGTEPECTFRDNLQSVAMMFAACAAGHRRAGVPVAEFLPAP